MAPTQRSVSVLIPTYNGAALLARLVEALDQQTYAFDWNVVFVDSGSGDDTTAIIRDASHRLPVPVDLIEISNEEFDHGDTRNLLAASSQGEFLVFLSQDAIPRDADWLARLVANFDDPVVGAVYCRQVPRPEAALWTRILAQSDPTFSQTRRTIKLDRVSRSTLEDPHARRLVYDFSNVASAVRRSLWERHPFPRTDFGEDVLLARGILSAGHSIVYEPEAVVFHSHEDAPAVLQSRARLDGLFNARWLGRTCIESDSDVETLARRHRVSDREAIEATTLDACERERLTDDLDARRTAVFRGLREGAADFARLGEAPPIAGVMLDDPMLDILYVVHGFPPESLAGTEIYTLELAREMQRRGHRVSIFARSASSTSRKDDFTVDESRFEGLRVFRMRHRLEHGRLRESYHEPRAEVAFRNVLERIQPDLVHFQHLIHSSAGLVHVAKQAGLPTVFHAHDYWALCSRVQMIRPDGARCPRNMGLGCHVCVGGGRLETVARWESRTARLGPLADVAARALGSGFLGPQRASRANAFRDLRARQPYVLEAIAANDLVIAPSRFLRDRLLDSGAFTTRQLVYSENGIAVDDAFAGKKRPDPNGHVRFGFIGSLVWHKGLHVLLRAIRRLGNAPVRLSIHGEFHPNDDPYHAMLENLATEAVDFHGPLDRNQLFDAFAEIDVLVVPSIWYENCPTSIREAFLARTPVVTGDVGGMAESVRDGVDGSHFAVDDDASLASCLARFVSEPRLLETLGRDFPSVKSMEQDAAQTESRYRSLCTFARVCS